MLRGYEAFVSSCEHLRGMVGTEFNTGSQLCLSMEEHVTNSGAGAASGHLWCVLAGWAVLVYNTALRVSQHLSYYQASFLLSMAWPFQPDFNNFNFLIPATIQMLVFAPGY